MGMQNKESRNNYSLCRTIEDKDVYKFVLDTRNFEISLFWQRSNYFLVLNSALAIGFFNLKSLAAMGVFALLGVFSSLLWWRVMLGSKYWQSRWEYQLHQIECAISPRFKLFSADRVQRDDAVKSSFEFSEHKGFEKFLETYILKKFSVSYNMTLLAFCFMFGWMFILLFAVVTPWKERLDNPLSISKSNASIQENIPACISASPDTLLKLDGAKQLQPIIVHVNVNGKAEYSQSTQRAHPKSEVKKDCLKTKD